MIDKQACSFSTKLFWKAAEEKLTGMDRGWNAPASDKNRKGTFCFAEDWMRGCGLSLPLDSCEAKWNTIEMGTMLVRGYVEARRMNGLPAEKLQILSGQSNASMKHLKMDYIPAYVNHFCAQKRSNQVEIVGPDASRKAGKHNAFWQGFGVSDAEKRAESGEFMSFFAEITDVMSLESDLTLVAEPHSQYNLYQYI